jgi:hypothetical protein
MVLRNSTRGMLADWDWRLIFWINVPVGIIGTIWA